MGEPSVHNCSAKLGGCIYIDCSSITFYCSYTAFTDSKSERGGVLYATGHNSRSSITFSYSRARNVNGGAICAEYSPDSDCSITLGITSCEFTNCSANLGGYISINSSYLKFTCYDTNFKDFKSVSGGLIYSISRNSSSSINITRVNANNAISPENGVVIHVQNSKLILRKVFIHCELSTPQMISYEGNHLTIYSSTLISNSSGSGSLLVISHNTILSLEESIFVVTDAVRNSTVRQSIFAPVDNLNFSDFQENGFYVGSPGKDGYVLNLSTLDSFHIANDGTSIDLSSSTDSAIIAGNEAVDLNRGDKDVFVSVKGSDTPYCSMKMLPCQTMKYLFTFKNRLPYSLYCMSDLNVATPLTISPLCTTITSDPYSNYRVLNQSASTNSAVFFKASSSNIRLDHLSFLLNPGEMTFFQMQFATAEFIDLKFKVRTNPTHPVTLFSMDKTHRKEAKVSMSLRIHDHKFNQSCFFDVNASVCELSNSALKNVVLNLTSTLFNDSIPNLFSCTFENVTVLSSTNPFLLNYSQNADNLIEHCLFKQCNVSHGSLIRVCAGVNLTVKNCSFWENEGNESGCIFVLSGESNKQTVSINNSFFRNNRHQQYDFVNASAFGSDVTSNGSIQLKLNGSRFASKYPQIVVNKTPFVTKENITELYLDPIGNDSMGCGTNTSNLCKTFLMAMNLQGDATNYTLYPSGLFCEKGVEVVKKTMRILGQKHAMLEISNELSSFIVRDGSNLTVKQVVFHIDKLPHGHYFTCLDSTLIIDDTDYTICLDGVASNVNPALNVSLFIATRSTLNIIGMRITGTDSLVISAPLVSLQNSSSDIQIDFWKVIVSENVSLLNSTISSGHLVLVQNCFLVESQLSRNSSFFSSTIEPNGTLKVIHCSFHTLASSDEDTYHLIRLDVTSNEADVTITNNNYSALTHSSKNGAIVCVNYTGTQNHTDWLTTAFPAPYPGIEWNSHIITTIPEENKTIEENIFSLIISEKDEYYVSPGKGTDSIDCGDFDTPCKTIKFMSTTIPLRTNQTRKLHLMDFAQNTAPINDSMCHEFTGTNATLSIGIERLKSEPVFQCTKMMTIHYLAIFAPPSSEDTIDCKPMIRTTNASLTVESVTFQQSLSQGPINAIYLEAINSSVTLVGCTFQHIKTQVVLLKLFVDSGKSVNMAGVTFSDINLNDTQNTSLITIKSDHQSQTNQSELDPIQFYNVMFKDITVQTGEMLDVTVGKGWNVTLVKTEIDKCIALGTLVHLVVWNTSNVTSLQVRSAHVVPTDTKNTRLIWIECKSPKTLPLPVNEEPALSTIHLHDWNITSSYCDQPSSNKDKVPIQGGFVKIDVDEAWKICFQNSMLKRLHPNINDSFGTVLVNFASPSSNFTFKNLVFEECSSKRGQNIGFIFRESVPRNLNQNLQVNFQYGRKHSFEYKIGENGPIHSLQYVQTLAPWHIALLSLATLLALPVVFHFLFCFPSLPFLFCFRKRHSSESPKASRLPRLLLPDGGLGQTDADDYHNNIFINSGPSRLHLANDPHAPTQYKYLYTRKKSDVHVQSNVRSYYSPIVKETLDQLPSESARLRESSSSSPLDTWMDNSSSEILNSTSHSSSKRHSKSKKKGSKGTGKKKRGSSERSGSESRIDSSSS
ncbi:hypothetical protein BLNAU_1433 [Blattamonas nauphoetae]|uniref:Transmembrane protein n=1 Tax=Blattamonas nauphoetae TaxID=2049346 RepID=A0ABQ9YI08_9EUKA|nr:hypothetical protein BLNAU_1433 [Blattamonas nauphoetae]